MNEPMFPQLDWTKQPELELLTSREPRPIVLRLPLTQEPDERWLKHFNRALSASSIGTDVACDSEGEVLVVRCPPPLNYDLPGYIEGVLQNAGIAWLNEQSQEEEWRRAMTGYFNRFLELWHRRQRNQVG